MCANDVYLLSHEHELDGAEEIKLLGFSSSEDRAAARFEAARTLTGSGGSPGRATH
jgi:hypothetical protein